MNREQLFKRIAFVIKNKRKKVVGFLTKYGESVKTTDSDVLIGKKLSKVLSQKGNQQAINDFADILENNSSNFLPIIAAAISSVFQSQQQQQAQDAQQQQNESALTLSLINANISKNKRPLIIIGVAVVLAIVFFVIIFWLKNKSKQ